MWPVQRKGRAVSPSFNSRMYAQILCDPRGQTDYNKGTFHITLYQREVMAAGKNLSG